MASVQDVLRKKGSKVWTTTPTDTVRSATQEMNAMRIGALLVMEGDTILGIFSERDVLTRIVAVGADPDTTQVVNVMTSPVAYCSPEMNIEECKAIFTDRRIRHLPVIENDKLAGIITSGDILGFEAEDLQQTVRYLEEYIHS
jgi:CBS domain-containing protein